MNAANLAERRARINAALARCAAAVANPAPDRWHFALHNGHRSEGIARLDDGWLIVDLATGKDEIRDPYRLLEANAALPGAAKYALGLDRALHARVECPATDDADGDDGLDGALAAVHAAWRRLTEPTDDAASAAPCDAHDAAHELPELVREAGWQAVTRADGRQAVDLEIADEAATAFVRAADGRIQAMVTLEPPPRPSARTRRAIGVLLLLVCGAVRLVRAAAWPGGELGLECVLAAGAAPAQLGHALAALRTGYRICAREVRALGDESLAQAFLSARGC